MALDYEQYLSDTLKNIYFGDQYRVLRERIQSDKELVFSVRKDQIHIYYLGGRILKITKSHKKPKLDFDKDYAKKKKGSYELNEYADIIEKLKDNPHDVDLWMQHFDDLKRCIKMYRDNVYPQDERQLQQNIELENKDFSREVVVIDNEYGVREKRSRNSTFYKVDLVTLYKDNGQYKICLVELKCGDGAIDKKSGIADHINAFKAIIATRKADIIASVNNLIAYKKLNRSLDNVPDDISLNGDTDICASILCYDLSKLGEARREIEKGKADITENGKYELPFKLHHNLNLSRRQFTLTKKDILGE